MAQRPKKEAFRGAVAMCFVFIPSYSVTRAVTGTLEMPLGPGISYVKSELLTEEESPG